MIASTLTIATSLSYYAFESTIISELEEKDKGLDKVQEKPAGEILKHEFTKQRFFRITVVLMLARFVTGFSYHSYGFYTARGCINLSMQGVMKGILSIPQCVISAWLISRSKQKVIPAFVLQMASAITYFTLLCLTQTTLYDQCSNWVFFLTNMVHFLNNTSVTLLWIMNVELAPHSTR